jgi:transcription elongation GreA/GreB family factor
MTVNRPKTNLNDLAAIASIAKSVRQRRSLGDAASEIKFLRAEQRFQRDRIRYLEGKLGIDIPAEYADERTKLRARIMELEGMNELLRKRRRC